MRDTTEQNYVVGAKTYGNYVEFPTSRLAVALDPLRTLATEGTTAHMAGIDAKILAQLPLAEVGRVMFYRRDEVTTDLICCDVVIGEKVWTFHEELVGWDSLIDHLQRLPNFRADWFAAVSQPPFGSSGTVPFSRQF